jgi:hypothetical protein
MTVVCCKENVVPGCQSQEIKPVTTYEYLPLNSRDARLQNIDESKDTVNLVISNQSDYDHYVETNPALNRIMIDFTKKTLLAGLIFTPSCTELIRIEAVGNCTEYDCTIVMRDLDCHGTTLLTYFVLIDKTNAKLTYDYVREN